MSQNPFARSWGPWGSAVLSSAFALACESEAPADAESESSGAVEVEAVDAEPDTAVVASRGTSPTTLERVYQGDGRYTVVDPDALEIGTRRRDGALVWEYEGPHVFLESQGPSPVTVFSPGQLTQREPVEDELRRTVRVDSHGRSWRIVEVDTDALVAEAGRHTHAEPAEQDAHVAPTESREEDALVTPFAWGRFDCLPESSPDGTDDQFLSDNSESRDDITAPAGRQKKAVLVDLDDPIFGSGSGCSGVLVDEEFVLTAAHCVSNSVNGIAWPEAVCPIGNNDDYTNDTVICQAVASVTRSPNYTGAGDVEDDYALLELITPVNPAMQPMGVEWGFMQLCGASDSTIDDDSSHFLGYPRVVGGGGNACNSFFGPSNLNNVDSFSECAQELFRDDGTVIGWTANRIKTDHDYSWGASGGPTYVCHGSDCGAGDTEHLTGLVVAHVNPFGSPSYNGGPKVERFRSWAQAILPNQ